MEERYDGIVKSVVPHKLLQRHEAGVVVMLREVCPSP